MAFRKSENINELAAALAKAQAEMRPAEKTKTNPFYKSSYADLEAVWTSCREPLSKYGLSVVQVPSLGANGQVILETVLLHQSGQWLAGDYPVSPTKDDPQSLGSAMSYARRYSLSPMVGVVTEDDDGEVAMSRPQTKTKAAPKEPPSVQTQNQSVPTVAKPESLLVTDKQIKRLFAIKNECRWSDQNLKKYIDLNFNKSSSKDLTWVEYDQVCKFMEAHPVPKEAPQ